jgi:Trp operon repressor
MLVPVVAYDRQPKSMDTYRDPFPDIPPISSFPSRKEWEAAVWKKVLARIHGAPSADALDDLLRILTHSSERRRITARAATMARLAQGISYRKIGNELWLSSQTINVIRKGLSERALKSYRSQPRNKKSYSPDHQTTRRTHGRYRRTKYGKIRIPY